MINNIYLRNSYGKWATVKHIAPLKMSHIDSSKKNVTQSTVGMLKIEDVMPFIQQSVGISIGDLTSSIITITEDRESGDREIQEFYGILLFKPLGGLSWKEQIDRFLSHPSEYEAVHPKIVTDNTDYVFFSKRNKQQKVETREKWM